MTLAPHSPLAMLDDYAQRFPDEDATTQKIRRLVQSRDNHLDRVCRPGHLTASAWVLSADRKSCLLMHHRKLNRWLQPGGHADGDSDLVRVAKREVEEESGIAELQLIGPCESGVPLDLDVHEIPARYNAEGELIDDAHEHHDFRFLFAQQYDAPLRPNEESFAMRWFLPEELCEVTDEASVLRLLEKSQCELV